MLNKIKTFIQRNQKATFWLSMLLAFMILFLVNQFKESINNNKLLKHAAFTSTQFTRIVEPYKKGTNGPWYLCYYEVNGNTFTSSEPVLMCKKLGSNFFSQKFPVIYDSTNPEHGRVLVFPFEFEELNLQFPDSLRWILRKDY
jgi:hypothetical protein